MTRSIYTGYTRQARDIMAVRRLSREVDERCAALYFPTIIISNGRGCKFPALSLVTRVAIFSAQAEPHTMWLTNLCSYLLDRE